MSPDTRINALYVPMDPVLPHGWADAYDCLAVGVVITNRDGQVIYANPCASDVFAPLQPAEFGLRALLGLSGATGGGELAVAVEACRPGEPMRLGLPNGRIFDSRCQPLANGGAVITLFDITGHIESAQRDVSDALTGLATRASFQRRLGELLASRRQGETTPIAIHCIGLDKFKVVNDTLGHPVGDGLLVKVAERIRSVVRGDDMIARVGGDEFAVIQTACEQPAAEALAARLVDLLGRTYIAAGHMISIGASVGVALAPNDGDDVATLLKYADLALHRAKPMDGANSVSSSLAWTPAWSLAGCLRWTCGKRLPCESLKFFTSRKLMWIRKPCSVSKLCCAGAARHAVWSHRACSYPWPKRSD